MKKILITVLFTGLTGWAIAQSQPNKYTRESTEVWSPVPRVVTPGTTSFSTTAPSDAIVLFDGKNLDNWVMDKDGSPAKWIVANKVITVLERSGDIRTKQEFEDFQLHIEFRTPEKVVGTQQDRGNSGVFMQGIYELQILDSYDNPTYVNGQAGAIYKQTMPLVNACKKPGEWQTYDIIYQAPKFNKDGLMLNAPYITVLQNGILVQNHTLIYGTTPNQGPPLLKPHGKGPVLLQDHHHPLSFRNIWIREL